VLFPVQNDPFFFLSPLDLSPKDLLVKAKIFPGGPGRVVGIIRGRKERDLIEALVAVGYTKLPGHPAAFLAILTGQQDETFRLVDPGLSNLAVSSLV
jgi:hypothetical protein